ncbi:zinc finger CCCH domain-containing protein 17-like [Quercus lobata]|uniref:C3H1-type domain-containing protein n=1 Tax=Quercus lobata TaxID=97700 RepID=A0A7N2LK07_QUELO|nr:zinc finger CCCH domain-containing protein 17-like [Quercus lobata]XP_030967663.1 zinc finger CCCH domain-containing protein 17-like [Quercus lobata]
MEIKTARRGPQGKESSVFDRLGAGRGGHLNNSSNKICKFWLSGRCLKNPCRFAHSETPDVTTIHRPRQTPYYPHSSNALVSNTWRRAPRISQNVQEKVVNHKSSENVPGKSESDLDDIKKKSPESVSESSSECSVVENDSNLENVVEEKPLEHVPKKTAEMVCEFWVQGTCVYGDQCPYLHSWFRGDKFKRLAELQGHNKAVSGIALPLRCNKLCSGSSDGTIRLWDCHTGQCANVINLGGEVGSVCSEGPWLFVGMPNVVKVWNTESGAEYRLNGPVGQVNALESVNDLLFAGVEDGVILAWKGTCESNLTFQLAATLKGHTHGITSLVVGGGNRLYSGSKDHTIRVWDHENWQCIMTLNGHDDVVKSLMCWDKYLFSGSLDCTIKVWASTDDGSLEVIYTHSEEQGILALSGMTDPDVKPILYCSCSDKSVHLYELPTFTDRGRLFAKQEVQTLQIGPGGLFFTGDQTGLLTVYTWLAD